VDGSVNKSLILVSPSPEAPGVQPGEGTALHELVHRVEAVRDGVKGAEWAFYTTRVSPGVNRAWEEKVPLARFGGGFDDNEFTRPDDFVDVYAGKDYGGEMDSSYEILSMGIEDLVTGEHGVIEKDEEHRQFTFGALALL
jgi:hypothetical protein